MRTHPPFTPGLGIPALPEPRNVRRRLLLCLILLGALGGAVAALFRVEWRELARGEGFVPWITQEWQAAQYSRKWQRPLVVVDCPESEEETLSQLLSAPAVQNMLADFVWHKNSGAASAQITVYDWKDRNPALPGPLPLKTLTPESLASVLRKVSEACPGERGGPDLPGPFF